MGYNGYKIFQTFIGNFGVRQVTLVNKTGDRATKYYIQYDLKEKISVAFCNRLIYIEDDWYAINSNNELENVPNNKLKTIKLYFDDKELLFRDEHYYHNISMILDFISSRKPNNYLQDSSKQDVFEHRIGNYNTWGSLPTQALYSKLDIMTMILNVCDKDIGKRFSVRYDEDIDLNNIIKPTPKFISKIDTLEGDIGYFKDFKVSINCLQKLFDDKKITRCKMCNKYDFCDNMHNDVCEFCYVNCMTICEECGEEIQNHEAIQGLCRNCYRKYEKFRVNNYGYNPPMKYYNDDRTFGTDGQSFSGIGIELEVDGGGENLKASKYIQELLNDEVYVKHDGSLGRGFEIITYPHTVNSFYKIDWKSALTDMIKHGYRSHDIKTCGLHMHVSRNMLTQDNLAKLIYFFETHKEDLTKFSRRDKEHLNKWACFYTDKDDCRDTNFFTGEKVTKELCYKILKQYDKKFNHDFRYKAINLQKKPTIEFRLMRGTLNYKTFLATIDFLLGLVRNSKLVSWNNIDDTKMWLRGMNDITKNYMKKRKCFGFDNKIEEVESDL